MEGIKTDISQTCVGCPRSSEVAFSLDILDLGEERRNSRRMLDLQISLTQRVADLVTSTAGGGLPSQYFPTYNRWFS